MYSRSVRQVKYGLGGQGLVTHGLTGQVDHQPVPQQPVWRVLEDPLAVYSIEASPCGYPIYYVYIIIYIEVPVGVRTRCII